MEVGFLNRFCIPELIILITATISCWNVNRLYAININTLKIMLVGAGIAHAV
jgi:hypothetical protein